MLPFFFLQKPIVGQDKRTTCCLCCEKGPVALRTQLERSAYVCGESIKLRANIDNQGEEVVRLKVKVIQASMKSLKMLSYPKKNYIEIFTWIIFLFLYVMTCTQKSVISVIITEQDFKEKNTHSSECVSTANLLWLIPPYIFFLTQIPKSTCVRVDFKMKSFNLSKITVFILYFNISALHYPRNTNRTITHFEFQYI